MKKLINLKLILIYTVFLISIINFKNLSNPLAFVKILNKLKTKNYQVVNKNLDKLGESIEIHISKPGFDRVLKQLESALDNPNFQNNPRLQRIALGTIYEITESLELSKERRLVRIFQPTLSCTTDSITRILDAEDDYFFYEYKNNDWEKVDQNRNLIIQIIKQVQQEKYLAQQTGKMFELRSNQKMTDFWKEFCKKEKIRIKDNTQSCINNLD